MNQLRSLWESPRFHRWGIPLILFIFAFTIRAIDPISRPVVWGDRAYHFSNAVLEGDWATTYQRYHPGVTLMWLSGAGMQAYAYLQGGMTPDEMLGVTRTPPGVLSGSVDAAILPLAMVIAAAIALTYPLVSRLLGRRVALVGTFLLAFSPFHVTYSKVLHPDGLLSMFMLLSALCLLLHVREKRRRWLILSGVFAGLAWLTKTPSLFLVPYTLLIVGMGFFYPLLESRDFNVVSWGRRTVEMAGTVAVWAGVGAVLFFLLWPAMWVKPDDALATMLDRILFHTTTPHMNPIFFGGQIWSEDPGMIFYVATIGFKTTLFSLPGIVLALVFAPFRWRTPDGRVLLALVAYAFFFTIQMGIGEFKQLAYLLPAFPALTLLAGSGLVWGAERLSGLSNRPVILPVLLTAAIAWQAGVVLYRHPYPGVHHNLLLGGTPVARHILPQQDQGEGLDIAARYLNDLPHGQDETAMIYKRSAVVFRREFIGRTTEEFAPWAAYRIYYINQEMRQLGDEQWQAQWEKDRQGEPLYTVEFDGIPFVQVYGERPEDPIEDGYTLPGGYTLGDHISLHETRVSALDVNPGDRLRIAHSWEASEEIDRDFVVFNHLISQDDGQLYAQNDGVPLFGVRPVYTWRANEVLEDTHLIEIPDSMPAGSYDLSIGMYYYEGESITRVPLIDPAGRPVQNNAVVLTTIEVTTNE